MTFHFIKKSLNFLPILTGILCILVTYLIWNHKTTKQLTEIDTTNFRETLFSKETELNDYLVKIAHKLKNSSVKSLFSPQSVWPDKNEMDKKGYSIYVYSNDTLSYWSENKKLISYLFSESPFQHKVIKLSNGWYLTNQLRQGEDIIIGLILIKHGYSIKNKYLRNTFHEDFQLPPSIDVSLLSLSFSTDIYDDDNNFMFSLIPANTYYDLNSYQYWYIIGLLIGVSLLFWGLYLFLLKKHEFILFTSIALEIIHYLILKSGFEFFIYDLHLFKMTLWENFYFLHSPGDLLFFCINLSFFISALKAYTQKIPLRKKKHNRRWIKIGASTIGFILFYTFLFFIHKTIQMYVLNTDISFEFYNLNTLSLFSFVAFVCILLLYYTLLILKKLYDILFPENKGTVIKYLFALNFLTVLLCLYFSEYLLLSFINLLFWIYWLWIQKKKNIVIYYKISFILAIICVHITVHTIQTLDKKQTQFAEKLIFNLSIERDRIAEHLLKEIAPKIDRDQYIKRLLKSNNVGTDAFLIQLDIYLKDEYFKNYWDRYKLEVSICGPAEYFSPENEFTNCKGYFMEQINEMGKSIDVPNYYFLDSHEKGTFYLGYHTLPPLRENEDSVTIYLNLTPKIFIEETGYPELLLDENLEYQKIPQGFSFAKYKNNRLVDKSGIFSYQLFNSKFYTNDTIPELKQEKNFNHIVLNTAYNSTYVLSWKIPGFFNILISFSYLFLFSHVVLFSLWLLSYNKSKYVTFQLTFRNRLLLSMILILVLSFLLVGGVNVFNNVKQYREKHELNIRDKTYSVLSYLESFFAKYTELTPNWRTDDYSHIDELLKSISEIFFTDINLFAPNGQLLGTSRQELYEKELIGKQMEPYALYHLSNRKSELFIQNESIGNLNFESAFIPLKNSHQKTIAYINLPFFIKPGVLQSEISSFIVTIINLYVLLFLLAMTVAVFISDKITQPLKYLQDRFKTLELGKKYQKINYKGKDEIGSLVTEYNKKVEELAKSVELLAKSERETAWREMAKQVAHEIKNPLTPMKLSVQFLKRSWQNDDAKFDIHFQKVTDTLIEQIENLSAIASEFSNFAKMPKADMQLFNIVEEVNQVATLFQSNSTADLQFNTQIESCNIYGDKKSISRVFVNLVKNALQATEDTKNASIKIRIYKQDEKQLIIEVKDNGTGIADEMKDKIFNPNFTTKSSGMGLGLAISKKIIQQAKGDIWFESKLNEGATFFVRFDI